MIRRCLKDRRCCGSDPVQPDSFQPIGCRARARSDQTVHRNRGDVPDIRRT